MDRITKSYLNEFVHKNNIEEQDESVLFEHFCNYTLLDNFTSERFELEDANVGMGGNIGIDGFGLILNGNFVADLDYLDEVLDRFNESNADVVFIQSKRSKIFELSEIGNFGFAVKDFISENPSLAWTETAKTRIELFNKLLEKSQRLRTKPKCYIYYVTLGKVSEDQNRKAKKDEIINDIISQNLFSTVQFDFLGAEEIQARYKKIGQTIEKSFEFSNRLTLPEIDHISEAYLGYLSTKTLIKLITDENGEILPEVFYDNVRDFQGDNLVNKEIAETISSDYNSMFIAMNNGITIISEEITTTRNTFTIKGFQIINGCQTSHVLFANKDNLNDQIYVPVRIISTKSNDVTSKIIRATNRQTEVKEQDLIAFTNFQKRLEDYFNSTEFPIRLYYERRNKQYNRSSMKEKE